MNAAGLEAWTGYAVEGTALPYLQDTAEAGVWASWNVTYRDVVILDGNNEAVAVFNLTEHNLGFPAEYDALRDLLLATAEE